MKLTKILVAMVAVLAFTAVAASGASAAEFTSSANPVDLTGDQETGSEHVFSVEGNDVECETAHFDADDQASPSKTITVGAVYGNCDAFGFAGAEVNMNGCNYEFLQPTGSGPFTGNVALRCSGTPITVHVETFLTTCHVSIGESGNTNLSSVAYTNVSGGDVKVDANVTGITVNKLKDTGLCPLGGTGHTTSGEYDGNTIVEGLEGASIDVG